MRRRPRGCRLPPRELLEVSARSSWEKAGAGGCWGGAEGWGTDTGPQPGWLKLQPRGSKRGSGVSAARGGVGSVRPTPWERHQRGCPSAAGGSRGWWHIWETCPWVPLSQPCREGRAPLGAVLLELRKSYWGQHWTAGKPLCSPIMFPYPWGTSIGVVGEVPGALTPTHSILPTPGTPK